MTLLLLLLLLAVVVAVVAGMGGPRRYRYPSRRGPRRRIVEETTYIEDAEIRDY